MIGGRGKLPPTPQKGQSRPPQGNLAPQVRLSQPAERTPVVETGQEADDLRMDDGDVVTEAMRENAEVFELSQDIFHLDANRREFTIGQPVVR